MKKKTNTSTVSEQIQVGQEDVATLHLTRDLKHSVLIVSVIANLFVFTTWVALQVTNRYDEQLASFLFSR